MIDPIVIREHGANYSKCERCLKWFSFMALYISSINGMLECVECRICWEKRRKGDFSVKLKLDENWIKCLLKRPETGMGYQKVDVVLKSGKTIKDVTVLNAEYLELPVEYSGLKLDDISDLYGKGDLT